MRIPERLIKHHTYQKGACLGVPKQLPLSVTATVSQTVDTSVIVIHCTYEKVLVVALLVLLLHEPTLPALTLINSSSIHIFDSGWMDDG